jgi:hypothetical protein
VLQRHKGWRRWALVAAMPLGTTPTLVMNWNTAHMFILEAAGNAAGFNVPLFAVRYPLIAFGHTETGAPSFSMSIPFIAIAYLIWLWRKARPARLAAS